MLIKRAFFLCLLCCCFYGCAGKAPVAPPSAASENPDGLIRFSILIEGLEAAYYPAVTDALKEMESYVRHTVSISRDGIFEAAFRFKNDSKVYDEAVVRLNSLFMVMLKTADIRRVPGALKIKVTEW